MFMKYVHTEDDPVRAAAELVNQRRQALLGGQPATPAPISTPAPVVDVPSVAPEVEAIEPVLTAAGKPPGYEDDPYASRTKLGNYRTFRHPSGDNRAVSTEERSVGKESVRPCRPWWMS